MNILLISTIYPLPTADNHGTKVCHFFAKEWLGMGYNVRTVHLQAVYPRPLYWIAKLLRNRIAAKTGAIVYTKRDDKILQYDFERVSVTRIPIYKPIPHGKFSAISVIKTVNAIIRLNKEVSFIPDIIVGHFTNPIIEVLCRLKEEYEGVKVCDVIHGDINLTKQIYGKKLLPMMKKIDVWGFRCEFLVRQFEESIASVSKKFICYSGIPESFITQRNLHSFDHPLYSFIYVGEMIERKYPVQIIDALQIAYPNGNYHINYVGSGQQLDAIIDKISTNHLNNQVSILGHIPREEIIAKYDNSDCMIMISRNEAYGLVYLEAMARGCITIASRNEGFDGIIKNGENGFLCRAGDYNELADIIIYINRLKPEERLAISENAIKTAKWLTDYNAAKMYIEDVINA